MQRPPADDSCSSSFSSTDLDAQMAATEALLVQRYGAMGMKQRVLFGKKHSQRRYFDSADYNLQKEGRPLQELYLLDCPIDQLPVKSEPTVAVPRGRSHLEHVAWATPEVLPVAQTRTVIDI
ncbi:hypothetical protein CHLRE_10g435350v5 [Chlamydomonas reinhardtii]|uniref:Uncharacterized protein n=2 Tax=Chlamydomonas reinhardtii TaxID=3055 RepID=A8IGL4_CHLRE|nr:uncharacterized protein CHLRE_10g435350v5 [Chlamydomonas reinhardtii]PNW77410.1 hypothetical protein CHLRE_10g435350v5 [Chlamydomonas reinhardtii]|eukprot:XP_001690597.1 endosulfine cAMP-regulated phosphoprotein [Chlamydomonas reinhardtii]